MKKPVIPILLALFMSGVSLAQVPTTLDFKVMPRCVGAPPGAATTLEQPLAFYVEFDSLAPNTAYSQLHIGFQLPANASSTRGSKWVHGTGWISPSTFKPFLTSDANGVIRTWIYLRTPSNYILTAVDTMTRVHVRIFRAGIDTLRFYSDFNVQNLVFADTATGMRAGAVVYGYTDTLTQNNPGKFILAYEKASDTRPLASWFVFPKDTALQRSDLFTTRYDTTYRRSGYFQLVVPANISIGKLEIRDTTNAILRSQVSTKWKAGAAGSKTNLSLQDNIALSVRRDDSAIPAGFALGQNYPNPFNPSTEILVDLPVAGQASLQVFDMLGREVRTLVNDRLTAGRYVVNFDASGLSTGVYLYRLTAGSYVATRKMVLTK